MDANKTVEETTFETVQDASVDVSESNQEAPKLSKNQRKKLLKLAQFQERKKLMRKNEKTKMKLKRKLAREEGKDLGPTRKELKLNKVEKNPADISIVIDLSFDELMTEKDLSSCSSQLMRIYTNNRRAKRPIPVHFTGLKEEGKLIKALDKHEGWMNWDIVRHSESFIDLFEKDKIIYLTSDSENVLDELEKGAVYVIGGLVDHNHHKYLTYELALKNKIRTARLPLSEHLIMKTRTVLTINQVFDIVLGVSEGNSWKKTLLEVMPQRKNIKAKNDDSEDENSSSWDVRSPQRKDIEAEKNRSELGSQESIFPIFSEENWEGIANRSPK